MTVADEPAIPLGPFPSSLRSRHSPTQNTLAMTATVSVSQWAIGQALTCFPFSLSVSVSLSEGSACAVVFDCKFIETSASLHHNVRELFEGIVRQIRLRKDSKEENARRMASCKRRESISKKAKRFLGRIVARKNKKMAFRQKSKSCHDLSVL